MGSGGVRCFVTVQLRILIFFFFFQAEDGIRDTSVTGVQTCALPISCDVIDLSAPSVNSPDQPNRRRLMQGEFDMTDATKIAHRYIELWNEKLPSRRQIGRASCRERV